MSRKMLINARSAEELRIAVVSDAGLENYQVEVGEGGLTRGNIYRGVISNLQPALNAAFVDYGTGKNGFLAIQDVVAEARYAEPAHGGRPEIQEILQQGKPIVIQVTREPENAKGAAITTNLSLAGRYLVFTPFDDTRGVSRKVEDEETRSELRGIAGKLELPDGGGVIVRTNALGETRAELQKDLAALLRVWKRIQTEARRGNGPRLLYSDQDLILRALRDHLDVGVDEILVDDETAFQQAAEYMQAFMPRTRVELTHYVERVPLFSKYSLESQIEQIFARTVPLPGGGSIVVDSTEALTAIDVNSGRAGSGSSHEDMALETNLQAAREVARQLRLRDLGGLVVVDFIDLRSMKNRRAVEKTMKDSLKIDRARSTVGKLSPNGLLEINRQRIQQSLRARAQRACPTCQGTGRVPSIESVGLNLMRRIEGRAATGRLLKARVEMHPELAEAMQNGRRKDLARLESEYDIEIEIVASHRLHGPEEQIEWRDRQTPITMAPHKAEASVRRSNTQAALAPVVFEVNPSDDADASGADGPDGAEGSETAAGGGESNGEARRGGKKRRRGGKRRRGKRGDLPVAQSTGEPLVLFAGEETFDDNSEPEDGQLKVIRRLHDIPVELPEVNGNVEPSAYVPHAGGDRHLRARQPPRGVPSPLAARGERSDPAGRPRRRGGKRRGGRARRPDGAPVPPGAGGQAPSAPSSGPVDSDG
ncbi:MAG: Rne/Rng family ribonuclease [Thermoanaerobaculia bacterium]